MIIPAPLEYSVSYMKGTARGPQAILDASSQIELYDEELDILNLIFSDTIISEY